MLCFEINIEQFLVNNTPTSDLPNQTAPNISNTMDPDSENPNPISFILETTTTGDPETKQHPTQLDTLLKDNPDIT